MTDRRRSAGSAPRVTTAACLAVTLVAGLAVTAPPARAQTGNVDQVRLAEPGKGWVARGDAAFVAALGDWTNLTMAPGEVEARTYLVRNMDARPGVWSVNLGVPAVTEHAYFAVGTETSLVPGGEAGATDAPDTASTDALSPPQAPASGDSDASWLAGPRTVDTAGVEAAEEGTALASIELAPCEAAVVTDWVGLPNFTDSRYAGQEAQPNISVSFTPSEGDPEEFVDGQCDSSEPTVIEESARVGQGFELDVRTSPEQRVAVNGELPVWLTLRDGVLRGTPTAAGTVEVLLTVTDDQEVPTDVLLRITVEPDEAGGTGSGSSGGFNFWTWLTGLFTGSAGESSGGTGGGSSGSTGDTGGGNGADSEPGAGSDQGGPGAGQPDAGGSSSLFARAAPLLGAVFGVVAVVLVVDFHHNRFLPWHWSRHLFALFR